MPDPIEPNPRQENAELKKRVAALEQFCKDLIKSLQAAESEKLFLLPQGEYFGITIE